MRFEFLKLMKNRWFLGVFVFLVGLNAAAFSSALCDSSKGYRMAEIRGEYAPAEQLTKDLSVIDREMRSILFENEGDLDRWLEYQRLEKLKTEALVRINEARNYPAYLEGQLNDNRIKQKIGMFGDENSFNVRAMKRSYKVYEALAGIAPAVGFYGGAERFFSWRFTDILTACLPLLVSLLLVVTERRMNAPLITHPTMLGQETLFFRKLGVILTVSLGGFVLLYGTNWVLSSVLVGNDSLNVPAQSVYGFINIPYPFTVTQYLCVFLAQKLAWALTIAVVLYSLSYVLRLLPYLLSAAAVSALSFYAETSGNLWIRSLNPIGLGNVHRWYNACEYLNFFGIPLRQLPLLWVVMGVYVLAGLTAGLFGMRKRSLSPDQKTRTLPHRKAGHSLFLYEGKKLYLLSKGAVLTLVLIGLQAAGHFTYQPYYSTTEFVYKEYSGVLEGPKNDAKKAYLEDDRKHFDEVREELAKYAQYGDGEAVSLLIQPLVNELARTEGYEKALRQYERLSDTQEYVYQTGYEALFDRKGIRRDLLNLIKAAGILLIVFAGYFTAESETGMSIYHRLSVQTSADRKLKLLHTVLFVLAIGALSFLPDYYTVHKAYGLPSLFSSAGNLLFQTFPEGISIFGVLLLVNCFRLFVLSGMVLGVFFLARKRKKAVPVMIAGISVFILPLLLVYAFL